MTLNDAILAATGGPTVNDGLRAYYNAQGIPYGPLNDMERAFLRVQMPTAQGTTNDLWMQYLTGTFGYTGTLNDMLLQYWSEAIFTPAKLNPVVWYDPSDLSTMFQDSAGTIPVTAAGQPVGLIRDKSGNGHHASQATDTKRPILYKDEGGEESGTFWYLKGDGVDDFLQTGNIALTGTNRASLFSGIRKLSDALQQWVVNFGGINPGAFSLRAPAANADLSIAALAAASRTVYGNASPVTRICTVLCDNSVATLTLRVNGVDSVSNPVAAGPMFQNAQLSLLSRTDGAQFFFSGHLYALIIVPRLVTAEEIADTERWVVGKTGIALP